ncbi:hypothetical protein [Ruegeria lacuscaerulensis]|uniref:hypothetical protein n=1 Tax=Ruegeria lacuscaerulensis TaxID=55218 RepID=UPI00147DAFC6|nr:hypothetical protein [Ruegeria lacuscaerulensis]
MKRWPMTIPYDLRCKLKSAREMRCTRGPQDDWLVVKEWLEAHGIEPPDYVLPQEPERI